MDNNQEQLLEEAGRLLVSRMEECGTYQEYCRKYNRHTLRISLFDEQLNEEVFEGKAITFFNEDNAIAHLSLLCDLFSLLTREENKSWGYKHTSQDVVDRILNPIRDKLFGVSEDQDSCSDD